MNCPQCQHQLTRREIVLLYSMLGGIATAQKKADESTAKGHPANTLTVKDVEDIRKSKRTTKELADKYKVRYLTVWRVRSNKTWLSTLNCPHCGNELTPHEIGVLYGTLGGSATSSVKARSSAKNGKLGGRPKKSKVTGKTET